jgi:hypothetical protein
MFQVKINCSIEFRPPELKPNSIFPPKGWMSSRPYSQCKC